ncbi:mitochondrial ribosome-associated GTPase 1 isoform X1 [Hydra vulgaris]|uniref:mitochondrial ribosome-associated GTPase 1 isoform X1 n=1 Tax=Hydra vulgaris TaxID=6087 RepID=UPI001F5F199D|nr:mitochondrial ribosome-associated GTPase 1 isoform X1 [Hydra vulgaris]
MRAKFEFPIYFNKDVFFKVLPYHMVRGLQIMRAKVNRCDCVIEIRDARVPLSCLNPDFEDLYVRKPRIILINKIDLADFSKTQKLAKSIESENTPVIFTNSKTHFEESANQLLPLLKDIFIQSNEIEAKEKNIQQIKLRDKQYQVLVCGIPNVGKSSFINAARRHYMSCGGKATRVGKLPGVTKSVLNYINISRSPRIRILDTPGISVPHIEDPFVGIKLALTGTFPDHVIGEEVIADFMLYFLNKEKNLKYLDFCGLESPCDEFDEVIKSLASKYNLRKYNGDPDYRKCSIMFVKAFREKQFGRFTLD